MREGAEGAEDACCGKFGGTFCRLCPACEGPGNEVPLPCGNPEKCAETGSCCIGIPCIIMGFGAGLPSDDPSGAMPGATLPLLGWTDQLTLSVKVLRISELRCSVAYAGAVLFENAGCCDRPKSPRLS